MSNAFPPPLNQLAHEVLATGAYRSEDDLLIEAIQTLKERDEAVAGIREGLTDLDAGRMRSLQDVDADIRKKYSIPQ